ncbi:hypothetical protein [Nevskia soli]|uniref:hypothetical protein n=1 Tax=Nevskia soli TaxID=418856 RepID=UPI0012F94F0B|nr:hypothetical protein [Nevskia soli]
MNTRLSATLTLVLSSLVAAAANAQGGGAIPGAASPYTQQRSQAYTSFDNPYAPGGIYDPYRGSKSLSSSQIGGPQSTAATSHKATRSKTSSLSSTQVTNPGSGSGESGSSGGTSAGGMDQCGSSRLGGHGAAGGGGMNRPASGMSSSSSRFNHCGGSSGYNHTSSGMGAGTPRMGGSTKSLNGRRGMNRQSTGMQPQH